MRHVRTPRSGNKISGRSAVAAKRDCLGNPEGDHEDGNNSVNRVAGGRISFRKGMARMAMKRNAPASTAKIRTHHAILFGNC